MSKVGAILLDTRSIQKYVFSCNELKTNVGASYIVDGIFKDAMVHLLETSGLTMPEKRWDEVTDIVMKTDDTIECEIVSIGGGNMLILVKPNSGDTMALCRKIVGQWTEELLVKAPGLKTGAAIGELELDDDKMQASLNALYKQLKENQNIILPQVDLPYSGFTLECDVSGKVATIRDYSKGESRWISAEVDSKNKAFKEARGAMIKEFAKSINNLEEDFAFPSDIAHLGQPNGESYICIVHIDGNNMGKKFNLCSSLQERKALSKKVETKVKEGFIAILRYLTDEKNYEELCSFLDLKKWSQAYDGKKVLPIRPIILGGDDVTFICPGRIGMQLTQIYMEGVLNAPLLNAEQTKALHEKDGKNLSEFMTCCAGVAIIPEKYPFFRAYQLAEELCSDAKKPSRTKDASYIEYALLHGEIYPTTEQLRKYQYEGVEGALHFGPYLVTAPQSDVNASLPKNHVNRLIGILGHFDTYMADSRNKIKKLREVLTQDFHTQSVLWELSKDLQKVVKAEKTYDKEDPENLTVEALWEKTENKPVTRYMDAIELLEFYPPLYGKKHSKKERQGE